METGGAAHNRRYVGPSLNVDPGVPDELVVLAHDPQTSGGLLSAVPPDRLNAVERDLMAAGVDHWRIGRVDRGPVGVALV